MHAACVLCYLLMSPLVSRSEACRMRWDRLPERGRLLPPVPRLVDGTVLGGDMDSSQCGAVLSVGGTPSSAPEGLL